MEEYSLTMNNDEETVSHFIERLKIEFEDLQEFISGLDKKKIKKQENITFWKKKVKNKKKDLKEWENKLLNSDLEEKTTIAEQEAQRREEKEREENIAVMKQEICELTVEKKKLEQAYKDSREQASKTYKALVAAMGFHKLYMKCYIDNDKADSTIFSFCFFCEDKPLKEHNYCVTLDYCDEKWKVIRIKPSVSCEKEISSYLEETGDIVGFVSHIHNVYAEMRKKH